MGLIAAKCISCGANIDVNSENDAGICPHCGTAFVTEKVINNYNTVINAQNVIVNSVNVENLIKLANDSWTLLDYKKAKDLYYRILEQQPDNNEAILRIGIAEGWEGNLNKTIFAFNKVFVNSPVTEKDFQFEKHYLVDLFNWLLINAYKNSILRYTTKNVLSFTITENVIRNIWNSGQLILASYQKIIELYEKDFIPKKFDIPNFLVILKNASDVCLKLSATYKAANPNRLFKIKMVHENAKQYQQQAKKYLERVKELS